MYKNYENFNSGAASGYRAGVDFFFSGYGLENFELSKNYKFNIIRNKFSLISLRYHFNYI